MTPALRGALKHCHRINGWLGGCPKRTARADTYRLTLSTNHGGPYFEAMLDWPDYREAVAFWESLHNQRKLQARRRAA